MCSNSRECVLMSLLALSRALLALTDRLLAPDRDLLAHHNTLLALNYDLLANKEFRTTRSTRIPATSQDRTALPVTNDGGIIGNRIY